MSVDVTSDKRVGAERALFKRIVIASQDLMDARACLNRLLGLNDEARATEEVTRAALTTALVLAYGRCCAPSRTAGDAAPSIPGAFRKCLPKELRTVHDRLLELRDTQFAHSDAEVANVHASVFAPRIAPALIPVSNRLRMPFGDEELSEVEDLLIRLHVYIYDELTRLSQTLAPLGPF